MSLDSILHENRFLVAVLVLSFILHTVAALTFPVSVDEGAYLYDGYAITKGLVPIKDFYTKSPLLLYTLAASIKLFGRSILTGRLVSILAALLTGVVLCKVGEILFNREVGLIASILYLLTPFSIAYTTFIHTESFHMLFVTLVMYLLIKSLDAGKTKYYVAAGVFLAFSILIRRTVFTLIPFIALCILFFSQGKSLKTKLGKLVLVVVGLTPIIMAFSFYSMSQAGFDKFFHGTVADPVKEIYLSHPLIDEFLLSWDQIKSKFRYFYDSIQYNLILVLPVFLFTAVFLKNKLKLDKKESTTIVFILYAIPLIYLLLNSHYVWFKAKIGDTNVMIIAGLYVLLLWKILGMKITLSESKPYSYYMLIIWIMIPATFYLIWYKFRGHYFQEFIPPLALIAAVGFKSFDLADLGREMKFLLIFTLTFMVVLPVYQIYDYAPSGAWDLPVIYEVSDYLRENTKLGDEIFTGATIFPFISGRDVVLDVSHPTIYYTEFVDDEVRNTLVPEISFIQEYLTKNRVEYAVIEPLTKDSYFRRYPEFEKFILSNYELVKSVYNPRLRSNIDVYKHK